MVQLDCKSPENFRSRQISVDVTPEKLSLHPIGEALSFQEIAKLRTLGLSRDNNHFIVANLGVSAALSFSFDNEAYLLLAEQNRPDFNDCVLKLISGYVPDEHLDNPVKTIIQEISEELLPFIDDNTLLTGKLENQTLLTAYKKQFSYAEGIQLSANKIPFFDLPHQAIFINGEQIEFQPQWYLHQPSNSLQLVFNFAIVVGKNWKNQLSLKHAEERYDQKQQRLINELSATPILLLPQAKNATQICYIKNGKIENFSLEKNLLLSEVFCPHSNGIIEKSAVGWTEATKPKMNQVTGHLSE